MFACEVRAAAVTVLAVVVQQQTAAAVVPLMILTVLPMTVMAVVPPMTAVAVVAPMTTKILTCQAMVQSTEAVLTVVCPQRLDQLLTRQQ